MGTLSVDKLVKTSTGAAEFTLPAADGSAGQVMQTDGAGQLSVAALAADTVTATQIASNAVTTTEIIDNAVTGAKIAMGSDVHGDVLYYNGTDYVRLGAGTSGQYLQTAGAAANPTWATVAGGLTHMSQWRLTSSFTSSLVPIVNNWAAVIASAPRTTTTSPTSSTALGAPMAVDGSTGFWTFPTTGWWVVEFVTAFLPTAYGATPSGGYINYADDGSTFVKVTKENGTTEANYHFNSINSILLKIEVTTTDKVTFGFYSSGAITCNASGTENYTYATFTRVGAI
jgi:hypothetical protein